MIPHPLRFLPSLAVLLVAGIQGTLHAEDYSITTFAGAANSTTGADGTPGSFNNPYGVAIDSAKNIYVADTLNNTIRKITPARVVSTLAGTAGLPGSADGTGAAARFNFPVGLAVDGAGNVYVADARNFAIRKITPAGVVTTLAGSPSQFGSGDGPGSTARFFLPYGIAVDGAGTLYVADSGNQLIRKITPEGVVSTLAGGVGQEGFVNGTGIAARFRVPFGVAVDGAGNVYVADSGNHAIRRITAAGVVSTVAGSVGTSGAVDGPAATARFSQPRGLAVDAAGNIFVADYANSIIRHITTSGVVSTIAGTPGVQGEVNSVGATARFYEPTGIAVDGAAIYVADTSNNLVRRGQPASTAPLPVIVLQPFEQEVSVGQAVSFSVSATGTGLTYQWLRNGSLIAGATSATYSIAAAQLSDVAAYSVRVAGPGGSVDSAAGNLSVTPLGSGPIVITARPLSQNVSPGQSVTLTIAASGSGLTFQWFKNGGTIAGATTPALTISAAQSGDAATYSVRVTSGTATETATAVLTVGGVAGSGISITTQPVSQSINAGQNVTFTVSASGSSALTYQWLKNDSAIPGATSSSYSITSAQVSDAGSYAVRVSGGGQNLVSSAATLTVASTGPGSRLVNLSILSDVASAGDSFTMGYVVGGAGTTGAKPILIRAAGPSLAQLNVTGFLADPKLELFAGSTRTGENDNWGGTAALTAAFSAVGAFPYINATSLDAAALVSISAGDNSVRVSASGNGTGTVIAELYDSTPIAALSATTPRLVNVSVLKHLGSSLTVGFVIDGTASKTVLIRAVGPTIGAPPFNVGGAVADPQMTLFSGQTVLNSNDNWGGTPALTAAFGQVGAFALPAASRDAALLATLQPGGYTVRVNGVGNTTGVAIVEVYEVP